MSAPLRDLGELRAVEVPADLAARIMTRVAQPSPPSLLGWLLRPRRLAVRLSLVQAGGVAVLLGLLIVGAGLWGRRSAPAAVVVAGAPGATAFTAVVLVRFELRAPHASRVALAGDFNDWNGEATTLAPSDDGDRFAVTVPLAPGRHEYMFIVDGQWVTDPAAVERRPDGFGRENAVLRL